MVARVTPLLVVPANSPINSVATLGLDAVAKSAPDGYTLGVASPVNHLAAPSLYPKPPYDSIKDFTPVGLIASVPMVLVVGPSSPAKSVQELLSLARSRGSMTMASAGSGSGNHIVGQLFQDATGAKLSTSPTREVRRPTTTWPQPLPYLASEANRGRGAFDVQLEVLLQSERMRGRALPPSRLTFTSHRHAYRTIAQMVAHHTVNGCNLQPGDLFGSGTLSGPTLDQAGALIAVSGGLLASPVNLGIQLSRTKVQLARERAAI